MQCRSETAGTGILDHNRRMKKNEKKKLVFYYFMGDRDGAVHCHPRHYYGYVPRAGGKNQKSTGDING